jgi:hypothetical protein
MIPKKPALDPGWVLLRRREHASVGQFYQRIRPSKPIEVTERLDQIVVGAAVEPGDAVVDAGVRRDHQHRRLAPGRARFVDQRNAVAVGKAEVDDHEVVFDLGQGGRRLGGRSQPRREGRRRRAGSRSTTPSRTVSSSHELPELASCPDQAAARSCEDDWAFVR